MASRDYQVRLEIFEGPLDLLLYLIKKNDLEVENIPISHITKEYLEYLELMKELKLEMVGEFLVMASTLMQIKAKSLLPSADSAEGDDGPDPRSELVAKLQEYQKFKEAAKFLQGQSDEFGNVFYRGAPRFQEKEKALNIRIFDLLSTLHDVLDRAEDDGRVILGEEFPIEKMMERILERLSSNPFVRLIDLFDGMRKRRAIITVFMALLELIKTQQVFARQEHPFADILIYKKEPSAEPLPAVWPGAEASAEGQASPAPAKEDTVARSVEIPDASSGPWPPMDSPHPWMEPPGARHPGAGPVSESEIGREPEPKDFAPGSEASAANEAPPQGLEGESRPELAAEQASAAAASGGPQAAGEQEAVWPPADGPEPWKLGPESDSEVGGD